MADTEQIPAHILEFARKLQVAFRAQEKHLEIPEILTRYGFYEYGLGRSGGRSGSDVASASDLRLHVAPARQAAMGVHLAGLEGGVLKILSASSVSARLQAELMALLNRGKLKVVDVEVVPTGRAEFNRVVRQQAEVSSERLVRTFSELAAKSDDPELIESAIRDIFSEALQLRASDIHLDVGLDDAGNWIDYRIDGDCRKMHLLPVRVMAPIITRLKTDAKLDAAERRRDQDGHIEFEWQGRSIDIRVATIPKEPRGEKLTLRLLDSENLRTYEDLFGRVPEIAKRLRRPLRSSIKDGGLILLSGPTGSGKTTSLFAMTMEIDRILRKVFSAEAPVEYRMPLVEQVACGDGTMMTMGSAVRAFMRQDPDVIVLGEFRDEETAEAGIRAVESGHLVLGTAHAPNAADTLARVHGFIPDGYRNAGLQTLIGSLVCVLNQRLVKTVCRACRRIVPAEEAMGAAGCDAFGYLRDADVAVVNPDGCEVCQGTGYVGRELVLEALFPPEDPRSRRDMVARVRETGFSGLREVDGTFWLRRQESIKELVLEQLVDARMAVSLSDELAAA